MISALRTTRIPTPLKFPPTVTESSIPGSPSIQRSWGMDRLPHVSPARTSVSPTGMAAVTTCGTRQSSSPSCVMIGPGMRPLREIALLFSPPITLPDCCTVNAASIWARNTALDVEIAERGLAPAINILFAGSKSKPETENELPLKLTFASSPRSPIAASARSYALVICAWVVCEEMPDAPVDRMTILAVNGVTRVEERYTTENVPEEKLCTRSASLGG